MRSRADTSEGTAAIPLGSAAANFAAGALSGGRFGGNKRIGLPFGDVREATTTKQQPSRGAPVIAATAQSLAGSGQDRGAAKSQQQTGCVIALSILHA